MAITIAKVISAFGIKGELKLYLHTDFAPVRFKKGKTVYFRRDGELEATPMKVVNFREDTPVGYLSVEQLTDRSAAETWVHAWIEIQDDQRQSLPQGVYYLSELIGCAIYDELGTHHGQVSEVITSTAQPLLRIHRQQKKDVLLPFVSAWVTHVDPAHHRIDVIKGEGMFDED